MNWRTAHNHRRRVAKHQLKAARKRRLTPWQRDLLRAFENFTASVRPLTHEMARFGKLLAPFAYSSPPSPDAADALAYGLSGRGADFIVIDDPWAAG